MKQNKNYTMENFNNRFNKAFSELPYCNNAPYYNTYKLLLGWWMEEDNDKKLNIFKNAKSIDFLDFISATSIVINKIQNGKTEFDFDNIQKMPGYTYDDNGKQVPASKLYNLIDGVVISKSNHIIYEYTLDLIDYIYACLNVDFFKNTGLISFSKYENN